MHHDSNKYGKVDFIVQNGMHIDLVEVKSGNDYKKHKALENILNVREWNLRNSYVFCRANLELEQGITYLPWYLIMFLHPIQIPKGVTYEVDISGLKVSDATL